MKLQLIHTEYYLIAVDDSKIEGGNKSLLILEGFQYGEPMILSHWQGVEDGYLGKKITHHLPLNNAHVLEGVELLPPLEYVEELAKQNWGNVHRTGVLGFIDGYNKAKEVYKFTEKDMRDAYNLGLVSNNDSVYVPYVSQEQNPKLPTAFDTETKKYIY